mmetsp:Transcript_118260/g.295083  ORF Transcript_118260/g.295083 Transcript_118260/m.295083 type:complete len:247 (-) Transcript_118260:1714-2454(-)
MPASRRSTLPKSSRKRSDVMLLPNILKMDRTPAIEISPDPSASKMSNATRYSSTFDSRISNIWSAAERSWPRTVRARHSRTRRTKRTKVSKSTVRGSKPHSLASSRKRRICCWSSTLRGDIWRSSRAMATSRMPSVVLSTPTPDCRRRRQRSKSERRSSFMDCVSQARTWLRMFRNLWKLTFPPEDPPDASCPDRPSNLLMPSDNGWSPLYVLSMWPFAMKTSPPSFGTKDKCSWWIAFKNASFSR